MTKEQKDRLLDFARASAAVALMMTPGASRLLGVSIEEASEWLFSDEIVIVSGSIVATGDGQ
jgi:hypothetical protein